MTFWPEAASARYILGHNARGGSCLRGFDGYVRVSQTRGREGPSFISLEVQRDSIQRWAEANGVEILAWHTDLDESGGKADRPGFQAMISRVENGETGGVIVAKIDRFYRSLTRALGAVERINGAGGQVVSVADNFDTKTANGKLVLNMMLSMAQFELERIREGWKTAQARAVARGVHIASAVPTGYIRNGTGRLDAHPDYADAITEVFRMRASGSSWRELCAFLDEGQVKGPYDARRWTTRAVQHLLANRAYTGQARCGEFVNDDAHQPLIDKATFEAVQRIKKPAPPRSKDGALLSGLLRCSGCRYLMKPDIMTLRDGTKTRLYRCRGEHASGNCPNRASALGSVIEPFVEARFLQMVGEIRATGTADTDTVGDARNAVDDAEAELARYRDSEKISGIIGEKRFLAGLESRAKEVERAYDTLTQAQAAQSARPVMQTENLPDLWPRLMISEKRDLLAAVIGAIFLRSGKSLPIERRALVLRHDELPLELPRRGRRVELKPFPWPVDSPS